MRLSDAATPRKMLLHHECEAMVGCAQATASGQLLTPPGAVARGRGLEPHPGNLEPGTNSPGSDLDLDVSPAF